MIQGWDLPCLLHSCTRPTSTKVTYSGQINSKRRLSLGKQPAPEQTQRGHLQAPSKWSHRLDSGRNMGWKLLWWCHLFGTMEVYNVEQSFFEKETRFLGVDLWLQNEPSQELRYHKKPQHFYSKDKVHACDHPIKYVGAYRITFFVWWGPWKCSTSVT